MKNDTIITLTLLASIVIAGSLGIFAGWKDSRHNTMREAVSQGYAEYCSATDGLVWLGECK